MRRRTVRLGPADILRLGLLGPRVRPLRAVLSSLGISIGIATMIVVVGIPASSQRALNEQLAALGTNLLSAEAMLDQQSQTLPPVPEEAPAMVARIPPVQQVSEVADTHAEVRRSQAVPAEDGSGLTALAADGYGLPPVIGTHVVSGHYLDPENAAFPTVVLGAVAATRLGITTLTPGQPAPAIWIGSQAFTVVGVLAPSTLAPDVDRSVLVGWQAAEHWLGFDDQMIVSVLERRREIGLRRALGATRRQVLGQFLAESVLLCLFGGIAGAVAGVLGTGGYAVARNWPAIVPFGAVAGGVGAALVVGVLAGVHPAVRASRLPPTEALATV